MKIALKLACLSVLLLGPAHGAEIEISSGVLCNTQKQVEEFVAFNDTNPQTAVVDVNLEERDPTACGVANVAFVRGRKSVTVRTRSGTFRIAEILVIGTITDAGMESVAPSIQFSVFKIDERGA